MENRIFIFFASLLVSCVYGQMVIGSTNVSNAAVLKLDMDNKALKIPILSVPSKSDNLNPVQNPARGLLLYNSNPIISENLDDQLTYWGNDSQYHSLTTSQGVEDVINDSSIPLMIFSTTVGPKSNIPCGSGACTGWTWTPFNPNASEILIDSYSGWNLGNNTYTIPSTDTFLIEYSTNISNSTNGAGTSAQSIVKGGTTLNVSLGRFVQTTNRAYTTGIFVQEFTKGDVLDFKYIYTQNNYQLQTGTINIYKY